MLISEALQGKYVKSSQGQGLIQYADFRKDMRHSTPEGYLAYACKVRPIYNPEVHRFIPEDFWTTVYVGLDSELVD
jgi:hypothetical protein